MSKKIQTTISILSVIALIMLVSGISWAAFSYARLGDKVNTITSGSVTMLYTEGTKFEIANATPLDNATGKVQTDKFDFSVLANSTGPIVINYEIAAIREVDSTLRDEDIVMYLTEGVDEVEKFAPAKYTPIATQTEIGSPAGSMILLRDTFDMGPNNKSEKREYTFRMWVNQNIPASEMGEAKTYRVRIGVYAKQVIGSETTPGTIATEYIESLLPSNPTTMTNDDSEKNVRYMGTNPSNFVTFNGELWRIIGVFNVDDGTGKKEKRLKIISEQEMGYTPWDTSDYDINGGNGVNEWSQSDLMMTLNQEAYDSLSNDSKNLIDNAVWYTGTIDGVTNTIENTNPILYFVSERNGSTEKLCVLGSGCNDTVDRTATWTGKIGLMYPSDYGLSTSGGSTTDRKTCLMTPIYNWGREVTDCSNNTWLANASYNWTITRSPDSYSTVFTVDSHDGIVSWVASKTGNISYELSARPVVYLKSNVKIIDNAGDGTVIHPYQLSL